MRRTLTFLFLILLVLTGALAGISYIPLHRVREQWRAGRTAEAIAQAEQWSRLRLWPRQYRQLLAAAHLSVGRRGDAERYLHGLRRKKQWISVISKSEVANRLFSRGRYADFLAYDEALDELREPKDVALYRVAARLATKRIAEAEAAYRDIDRDDVDPKKLAALERALHARRDGTYPVAVDRNGQVVAAYALANDDVVAVNTEFSPLIERNAGQLTIEAVLPRLGANERIQLTLDAGVQKAALQALSGFRGSLVAIDPKTNEILAAASTVSRNLALEGQYEPGSVVKVLTGLAAVGNRVQLEYPYECNGVLPIDGRNFGDWKEDGHGTIAHFNEALAQSCNVAFADYGVRLGRDKLKATMTKAGFDTDVSLGLFTVPLGRTDHAGIFNNFETAFYAIGVQHQTTTPLHLAMIASMMANRGVLTTPRIYSSRESILGETVDRAPKQTSTRVATAAHAEEVIRAMVAVVESEEGTGRRADIDGLSLAMKTGTAGKREDGFHAVVIAFAPVENPRIAIGMVAESAGPAEFAAAKIVRDFLIAIRPRL